MKKEEFNIEECTFWDFNKSCLVSKIYNTEDSKFYRSTLSYQMELLGKHNGRKLLLLAENNPELSKSEKFYTNHIYIPKMIQTGLKHVAIVAPMHNVFKEIFIENLKDTLEGDILETAFFIEKEKAFKWLEDQ